MTKKVSFISNCVIAAVLLVLCFAVMATDLSDVYISVSSPVYNGDKNKPNVSIMFNVCEGTQYVRPIMDTLSNSKIEATFFLCGNWVQNNMALAKDIASKFEVGNRAYSHKKLTSLNETQQKEELQHTHSLVKSISQIEMKLFTPPFGNFNKTTLKVADSLGYKTIMGSKDATACTTADCVFEHSTNLPKNGDLLLLEPTAQTVASLEKIIGFYKTRGFAIVSVGRNIL